MLQRVPCRTSGTCTYALLSLQLWCSRTEEVNVQYYTGAILILKERQILSPVNI
ncbi:hypothetical protein WN55_04161 [Dufourea novaeangliae]|uniref:Uncharacterized protein n=1 Tax=Dufourea novaeangliae TaxID=178035 RepID=A0A154PM62_DUFNO|nr:hypothetical protein WN55_04161 [Dufourea novaeangliae]